MIGRTLFTTVAACCILAGIAGGSRTAVADDLYVATLTGVTRFSPSGVGSEFLSNLPAFSPLGIAFDATGNLYLSHHGIDSLTEYARDGSTSVIASYLNAPYELAMDASGNFYTAKDFNQIAKVTRTGDVTTVVSGLSSPNAVAFGTDGSTLYYADINGLYKLAGGISPTLVAPKSAFPGGAGPVYMAFDRFGNLFVSDYHNGSVDKVTPDGTVSVFGLISGRPEGLAFDNAGNLFVAEYEDIIANGRILEFNQSGVMTVFATGVVAPEGIAFGPGSSELSTPEPGATALLGVLCLGGLAVRKRTRITSALAKKS